MARLRRTANAVHLRRDEGSNPLPSAMPTQREIDEAVISALAGQDQCEYCGEYLDREELIYGPDPYAQEINGDETERVLCSSCYRQSAEDI